MKSALSVFRLIDRIDSRGMRTVLVLAFCKALIDVAGIASIAPFLSLVSNPEIIRSNALFAFVFQAMNFPDERSFIIFSGGITIAMLTTIAALSAIIASRFTFFMHWQRHTISTKLFNRGFYSPSVLMNDQHSTVLTSRVFGETDVFIDSAVRPLIELIANGALLLAILSLLIVVDPWSTLAIVASMAIFFGGVILATRNIILRSGESRAVANAERYRSLKEALAGALELRLLGREALYISRFHDASERFARSVAHNQVALQVATYAVQALTFAGIIALTIMLLGNGAEFNDIIPNLGLFLFAGYRIMPAANICYHALSTLRYARPAISAIQNGLKEGEDSPFTLETLERPPESERITCLKEIRMENIFFSYGVDQVPLVIDSITFPAGKIIGIIGPSGSGKSTLFSLLLGLQSPQRGKVMIDGVPLDPSIMRQWHNTIGFVSQRPFLSDESVAANIALGLSEAARDDEAIKSAANLANVTEFIDPLPEKFDSTVGEDGGRLSGGQRQRISIARALYHKPDVLFLDEITSALDDVSENAISNAIVELGGQRTVFIIAHRPAMLKICDFILKLEGGRPVDFGPAHEVMRDAGLEGCEVHVPR